MRAKTILTVALTTALLAVGVGVPTAGQAAEIVPRTDDVTLDGLPSAPAGSSQHQRQVGAVTVPEGRTSRVVETPIPFSMIGLSAPPGVDVWLRTSRGGEEWSAWQLADIGPGEGPDPGSPEDLARDARLGGRIPSDPIWVSEATHVQIRTIGEGPDARPERVAVHAVDSMGLSRSVAARAADAFAAAWRGSGTPAHATSQPSVISRSDWGADEDLRKSTGAAARSVRGLVVHHTAGSNSYSESEAPGVVRGIYRYHTQSNGWDDIGYNLLIDRYGKIYEGRYGGIDRAVIGAHVGGFNSGSSGISLIGHHGSGGGPPTAAALNALERILTWKADIHHVRPTATVSFERDGKTTTVPGISGHRDFAATECPGAQVYNRLADIRRDVEENVGDQIVAPEADSVEGELTLTAGLVPSGQWQVELRSKDGALLHRDSGRGASLKTTWDAGDNAGVISWEITSPGRRTASGTVGVAPTVLEPLARTTDPVAGAVAVSREAFDRRSAVRAVVARDDVFADALAGGPLAGGDGPLLLTGGDELDSRVLAELERVLDSDAEVYLLGGTAALSSDVAKAIADGGWTTTRLSGPERIATAAAVAEAVVERTGATSALVARAGPDSANPWADALAGGAYGAHAGWPVLLTTSDSLSPPVADFIADHGIVTTIVLGGTVAISDEVADELPLARRVAGQERAGTAAAIAETLWRRADIDDAVIVANGHHPDAWTLALVAAPLAARGGAPLLLAEPDIVPPRTAEVLGSLANGDELSGWILGADSWLSPQVRDRLNVIAAGG